MKARTVTEGVGAICWYTSISYDSFCIRFNIFASKEDYLGWFEINSTYNNERIDSYIINTDHDLKPYVDIICKHIDTDRLIRATLMVILCLETPFSELSYEEECGLYNQMYEQVLPASAHFMDNGISSQTTQVFVDRMIVRWNEHLESRAQEYFKQEEARRNNQITTWLSLKQSGGFIYLVKGVFDTPAYKIGYSKTPKKRIEKFDVVLPFPIDVLHLIETNHMRAIEAYLHDKYDDRRVNGEWFELSDDDVAEICAIETLNAEEIA